MRPWPEGQAWIREQNYDSFVHSFESYLAEDVYRDFLLAADCAVHLRSSDYGQPSAGLVDCISAGMPSVANESLAASSDTPGYVTRIADRLSPHNVAGGAGRMFSGFRPCRASKNNGKHSCRSIAFLSIQAALLSSSSYLRHDDAETTEHGGCVFMGVFRAR